MYKKTSQNLLLYKRAQFKDNFSMNIFLTKWKYLENYSTAALYYFSHLHTCSSGEQTLGDSVVNSSE